MFRARHRAAVVLGFALSSCALAAPALADPGDHGEHHGRNRLEPGNIVISRSVYEGANITPGVTQLPPGCAPGNCGTAVADGTYPSVFNNDAIDGSFGITSPLFLDELTPWGDPIKTIDVPTDDLVTSFSSKSEGALNVSTNGRDLTFMDYAAPVSTIDVSNANAPGEIDPTNPVPGAYYRTAAELDSHGRWHFTETRAYSGNNGRAAILDNADNVFYSAGNAGNGSNPQPSGVVLGAGAQIFSPADGPESAQNPPAPPTPVGSFDITELGDKQDKVGKDDNFRGLTVYDNVVYLTKGSGGNGVNTVYFIDTTGTACPNGVGLPVPGAPLPTTGLNPASAETNPPGPLPSNMCVLKGFNTTLAKTSTNSFPFGIWFANPTTLYVADEGNGDTTYDPGSGMYTGAAAQTTSGLQKWVFANGSWSLADTLQNGLQLGVPYAVPGYPTGDNAATGLPWAPATDGLRNITGRVSDDGTATIWAVTSTVSGSGDQGADPNKVVKITDELGATSPGSESFRTFDSAGFGEVLRGVSVTPPNGGNEGDDHGGDGGDSGRHHHGFGRDHSR